MTNIFVILIGACKFKIQGKVRRTKKQTIQDGDEDEIDEG
jgi:hypothetical protein